MTNIRDKYIAALLQLSSGRKYLATFALGALMALAMPRGTLFLVLLISVPSLSLLTQQSRSRAEAFRLAWVFGAGYFIIGLYWVSAALLVDIAAWWWVLPLSSIVGPTVLGIFYGFIPLLAWRYREHRLVYGLVFAASWSLIEWIRGHILTGFPWNMPGHAWHFSLEMLQVTSYIGIYGLTLITLLWTCVMLTNNRKVYLSVVASFLIVLILGALRLHLNPTSFYEHNYTVRIVQPNIPQKMKWEENERAQNLQTHLQLTALASTTPIHAVLWPETATTLNRGQPDPAFLQELGLHLPHRSIGIIGTLGVQYGLRQTEFFNGITFLTSNGHILTHYDKHHLVPFGEYIPFRQYLNLTPLAAGISIIGDFTSGQGVRTVPLPKLPSVSPQVCYEGIFPQQAALRGEQRPAWMLNVTNDAWYGRSAGPYQHLEITRIRAIEEGLPLARAANTGISAMIDPLGRDIARQPLGTRGVLDAPLPQPLPPTLYAQWGDTLFFFMLIAVMALGEALHRKQPRN